MLVIPRHYNVHPDWVKQCKGLDALIPDSLIIVFKASTQKMQSREGNNLKLLLSTKFLSDNKNITKKQHDSMVTKEFLLQSVRPSSKLLFNVCGL